MPKPDLADIIESVVHAIWHGLSASILAALAGVLLALLIAVRGLHAVVYPRWRRDPLRRFPHQDKIEILRRAGGRCEHHSWLGGRCHATDNLEADHIIPWSRSGPTIIGNGQALCGQHNRAKRAKIPFRWQLNAIAKRRSSYYPAGVSGEVARLRSAGAARR